MAQKTIIIAGASGFVGQQLSRALLETHQVIGLSRSRADSEEISGEVTWRNCDLLSLEDARRCLKGGDVAFYLVHAMMPSDPLTSGDFADMDLMAADNFARAARDAGVRQIIYLGGLVPEDKELSPHLASRLEVEEALGAHGVPVTTLRAGLVLGAHGSSATIMLNLVRRLPMMVCPAWTKTRTQPVALSDVLELMQFCVDNPLVFNDNYDIGSPDVVTYRELMELASDALGMDRPMFSVPLFTPQLSRLWVSLVTGAPRELVAPLIESLTCEMVARDRRLHTMAGVPGVGAREAIQRMVDVEQISARKRPKAFFGKRRGGGEDARGYAIFRLPLPEGRDARWVAQEYLRRLPELVTKPFKVKRGGGEVRFMTRGVPLPLLGLDAEPSGQGEPVRLKITSGLLAHSDGQGALEFREVRGQDCVLVTLRGDRPKVWSPIYRLFRHMIHTQTIGLLEDQLGDEVAWSPS